MKNRMSSLPVTQFCGTAGALSAKYGAGRAAAMGSYFHALCAETGSVAALRAKLTEEELVEVATWHRPGTIEINGVTLDYASAEKELEVMLTDDGEHTHVEDEAICVGHLDFAWQRKVDGQLVAYVADIKKSEWTVSGPESLQIAAYGWAYAQLTGADAFVPGIWAATEGKWIWGEWFDMRSFDAQDLWLKIKHAAMNDGEAGTGPHCRNCYARLHCPEFLFPKSVESLAVFSDGHDPTGAEIADAVLAAQAMEDIAKRIKENAKEYVRRGFEIRAADGKVYKQIMKNGAASVDVKNLAHDHPELAAQYTKPGGTWPEYRWAKG